MASPGPLCYSPTRGECTRASQVESVRSHEIIVTTHGSHGVSFAFAKPCTAVVFLLQPAFLVTEFAELASQAGARAFFLHHQDGSTPLRGGEGEGEGLASPGGVTAHAEATLRRCTRSFEEAYRCRNSRELEELSAGAVHAVLHEAADAHRRCVAGTEPPVRFDGIPTMGGVQSFDHADEPGRCFSCYESRWSCCNSSDATRTYVSDASACRHCMPVFRKQRDAEVCAAAKEQKLRQCRLTTMIKPDV